MEDLKEKIMAKLRQPTLAALATVTAEGKPWVRYVTSFAGESMVIRFATGLGSRKVGQIKANPEVHMTLGVTDPAQADYYLQVQGRAQVRTDLETKQDAWFDPLSNYFSGPEDPNMAVVEITPYRVEIMSMTSLEPQVWEA